MTTPSWDRYFLDIAATVATKSKDPSTKVGAVVVDDDHTLRCIGFNGMPPGIKDTPGRLNDRDLKYKLIVHAELNAILRAALVGVSLKGCTLFCTLVPCSRCALHIIGAGISEVVYPYDTVIPDRWTADMRLARDLLAEAGVGWRTA